MAHARKRLAQVISAALVATASAAVPAAADDTPGPLTDPTRAAALAHTLGDHRTGGVYYRDGRLVVAVTDRAAAQSVRDAGGIPKLVTRSMAELKSIHDELDDLGAVSDTSWGEDARTNRVEVEAYDDAPAAGRARIDAVAAAHPGAVHITRHTGTLGFKDTDIRGANGITSQGWLCSAGFNAKNSSGTIYTLTAGHCVPGTGNTWYMDWNFARIGDQTAYRFGGSVCDVGTGCDWATIRADDPGIHPVGSVRYWGGTYKDITSSRWAVQDETTDRIGVSSQDTTGGVVQVNVTVTIDGIQLRGMISTTHCALGGDSGGPLLSGSTALGLLSGGTDETTCNSSADGYYRNYFTPVQSVLSERNLHVY